MIDSAIEYPAYGQLRASNELKKRGIMVSSSGARSVWVRNDLVTFKQRLKALEAKVLQDGIILTEEQLRKNPVSNVFRFQAHCMSKKSGLLLQSAKEVHNKGLSSETFYSSDSSYT